MGLPPLVDKVSRCNYVEDNEPDTQGRDLFSKCILSRICRYIQSIAYHNNQSMICCREALRHSSTRGQNIEQATKVTGTLNVNSSRPRDLIAYGDIFSMRKRSFHSSSIVGMKGNSTSTLENKTTSNGKKNSPVETKPIKAVKTSLTTIVAQNLSDFETHDFKYKKIIQLITDPYFLIRCYDEIKGKPGNMTRGVTKETLDGLNFE